MATTSATTDCALAKLPTELLGTICDLVAEGEMRPVLCIEIEQDPATQQKLPRLSAFAAGLSGTRQQLRNEYSAALKRDIEALMTRRYGDAPLLVDTRTLHYVGYRERGVVSKALQIYASAGPGTRNDKEPVHRVHALAAFIPTDERQINGRLKSSCVVRELVVIFVADGSKSDLSSSRIPLVVPRQSLGKRHPLDQRPSLEVVTALEEMKQVVRETKWAGNLRYYMLWFDYVVRYTKDLR